MYSEETIKKLKKIPDDAYIYIAYSSENIHGNKSEYEGYYYMFICGGFIGPQYTHISGMKYREKEFLYSLVSPTTGRYLTKKEYIYLKNKTGLMKDLRNQAIIDLIEEIAVKNKCEIFLVQEEGFPRKNEKIYITVKNNKLLFNGEERNDVWHEPYYLCMARKWYENNKSAEITNFFREEIKKREETKFKNFVFDETKKEWNLA